MALRAADGRVGGLVLGDAVGVEVPGHPITDISGLTPDRIADYSYADPDRFRTDPTTLPAERLAANAGVFAEYAGSPYMHDPTLLGRLAGVTVPAAVVRGEADGIVDVGTAGRTPTRSERRSPRSRAPATCAPRAAAANPRRRHGVPGGSPGSMINEQRGRYGPFSDRPRCSVIMMGSASWRGRPRRPHPAS